MNPEELLYIQDIPETELAVFSPKMYISGPIMNPEELPYIQDIPETELAVFSPKLYISRVQ